MFIDENILQYIWKYQLFPRQNLKTETDEVLSSIVPGQLNLNAGPDFYESVIKIGDTLWAGSVEIHVRSSDWNKHKHHLDQYYDGVILHVVWLHDKEVFRTDGSIIPVLELNKIVDQELLSRIDQLTASEHWIPCQEYIHLVDHLTLRNWLDRLLIERLAGKSENIEKIYNDTKGNWETTFYILLASNFGFKINQQPFEMLAGALPQHILAKHKNSSKQIEALIFGVAGMLDLAISDQYSSELKREFDFMKHKYGLNTLDRFVWKYSRIRPENFPDIRLAQFAILVYKSSHLFSRLLRIENIEEYRLLFNELKLDEYWENHYRLGKLRKKSRQVKMGTESIDNMLINSIAPMLFFYGHYIGDQAYKDKALKLLDAVQSEDNYIIKGFRDLGLKVRSATESQGLIQLKKIYCNQKKCLNCAFGIKILKH